MSTLVFSHTRCTSYLINRITTLNDMTHWNPQLTMQSLERAYTDVLFYLCDHCEVEEIVLSLLFLILHFYSNTSPFQARYKPLRLPHVKEFVVEALNRPKEEAYFWRNFAIFVETIHYSEVYRNLEKLLKEKTSVYEVIALQKNLESIKKTAPQHVSEFLTTLSKVFRNAKIDPSSPEFSNPPTITAQVVVGVPVGVPSGVPTGSPYPGSPVGGVSAAPAPQGYVTRQEFDQLRGEFEMMKREVMRLSSLMPAQPQHW